MPAAISKYINIGAAQINYHVLSSLKVESGKLPGGKKIPVLIATKAPNAYERLNNTALWDLY